MTNLQKAMKAIEKVLWERHYLTMNIGFKADVEKAIKPFIESEHKKGRPTLKDDPTQEKER